LVNMVIVHQMFLQIIKPDATSFILILTSWPAKITFGYPDTKNAE